MGETLIYDAAGTACHGFLARPEGDGPWPGLLVAPAFWGLSDTERGYCERLAGMGYVVLGVDYYGGGALTSEREEAARWMAGVASGAHRPKLAQRMGAALQALKAQPGVETDRCGALGYCLGGKAVLDLARSGADFRAGVSFHGVYDAPESGNEEMRAALLVCDGWDDPLCPPEAKLALAEELNARCADWQFLSFGHTVHAFTNRAGSGFSEQADARSWAAMARFFAERLRPAAAAQAG